MGAFAQFPWFIDVVIIYFGDIIHYHEFKHGRKNRKVHLIRS